VKNRYIGRQLTAFRRVRGKIIPIVMKATAFEDPRVPKTVKDAFTSLQKTEAWSRSIPKVTRKFPLGKFGTGMVVKNLKHERLKFFTSIKEVAANPSTGKVFSRYARMILNAAKKVKR